jgi:hypothetical protein
MSSLQKLCYEQLAVSVQTAPPLIQEMIMGETRDRVKKNMKAEVKAEVMPVAKQEAKVDICKTLPYLVPEIMEDIIAAMTENGRMRRNFREDLSHLSPEIVECAILTAELAVRTMETHYVHRAFSRDVSDYDSDSMY